MYRQLHCIALRTIKYNDKHSILSVYTLEMGSVSFLISAAGGREAMRRRAMFMPLNVLECIADIKPGRELHTMREPRVLMPLHGVHTHPVKNGLAMFIAEVLGTVLRECQQDEAMYRFLADAIAHLDGADRGVANFHLCFLYRLGRFLGIEPDVSTYRNGMVFDLLDGRFRASAPLHGQFLGIEEAHAVMMLARMTYENLWCFKLTREQRNELLDNIIKYYIIHYGSLAQLQSIDVLRSLYID